MRMSEAMAALTSGKSMSTADMLDRSGAASGKAAGSAPRRSPDPGADPRPTNG